MHILLERVDNLLLDWLFQPCANMLERFIPSYKIATFFLTGALVTLSANILMKMFTEEASADTFIQVSIGVFPIYFWTKALLLSNDEKSWLFNMNRSRLLGWRIACLTTGIVFTVNDIIRDVVRASNLLDIHFVFVTIGLYFCACKRQANICSD